jgi:hypothetical protein
MVYSLRRLPREARRLCLLAKTKTQMKYWPSYERLVARATKPAQERRHRDLRLESAGLATLSRRKG